MSQQFIPTREIQYESTNVAARIRQSLLTPIQAMRLRYMPLLMIYFAYGALGLIGVAQQFWTKQSLALSPAELAGIGVWLTFPWTIKMIFGQMVDSVAIMGSNRRVYAFGGAGLIAAGLIVLAGTAGGWIDWMSSDRLYVLAMLLVTVGVVIQDVVADAMSTEVVDRVYADGRPRPHEVIRRELGMVQVLGRLALTFGVFATAGLAGWLANEFSYETVFLLGLIVPVISVLGTFFIRLERTVQKPVDWRILGGGVLFGCIVVMLGIGGVPLAQEIVFVVSMAVISFMLFRVVSDVDTVVRQKIFYTALIVFLFRATPEFGDGYGWFAIDVLGFDEAFQGTLRQIGAGVALVVAWLLSDLITRQPIIRVLIWLTVIGTVLAIPNLGFVYGLHEWTEKSVGIGARTIAVIDTAAESPLAQLSMVPILTLIAIHAPEGRRATWFALMASLMNLALMAGQLQTKYLNQTFLVERGEYEALGILVPVVIAVGFIVPMAAALTFGRRAT